MSDSQEPLLTQLGFRFGLNGPHAARTMMLADLATLLSHVAPNPERSVYYDAVVNDNVLGKPTKKSRELALRHLATLYGLEPTNAVFRAVRRLWDSDACAQPLLALLISLARDPLLGRTQGFFIGQSVGASVARADVEALLENQYPDRFSTASLKSFAQNISGTWSSAGFLEGRSRKHRATPEVKPAAIALALFLGYLEGRTGQRLFTSRWVELLCLSQEGLDSLAKSASHKGLLVYMDAGGVKELRFPGYLTAEEEKIRQEISHVV